jgi:hypothetical protein
MDHLRDKLASVFEQHLRSRTADPWCLRDGYIEVILDRTEDSRQSLLERHGFQSPAERERVTVWKLLEMQRAANLMYTSCGWFFDDIAGIESVQVLQYAARAMQLAQDVSGEDLEPGFLALLKEAPSNDPSYKSGIDLYEKKVKPAVLALLEVGVHHGIASLFLDDREAARSAAYSLRMEAVERREKQGVKLALGRSRVRSLLTGDAQTVSFCVLYQGEHRLQASARSDLSLPEFHSAGREVLAAFQEQSVPEVLERQTRLLGPARYSLQNLFKDTKRRIVSSLLDATLQAFEAAVRPFYAGHLDFIQAARRMNVPLPDSLGAVEGFLRQKDVVSMLDESGPLDLEGLRGFAEEVRGEVFPADGSSLAHAISRRVLSLTEALIQDPGNLSLLEPIVGLLDAVGRLSLRPDLWQSQNRFFEWVGTKLPDIRARAGAGDPQARRGMELADRLGKHLSIEVPK